MANVAGSEVPAGVEGEKVHARMRDDFGIEIGSFFGPLQGRIWRIGAMGWNCTRPNVLDTLASLEAVRPREVARLSLGAAADAALAVCAS